MAEPQILEEKQRLKSLRDMLHQFSAPAAEALIERAGETDIRCFACGHRCLIKPGHDGVCRVRFNDNGTLLVPYGYVGCLACDPIEKKPFFHCLPGSDALTFGVLGCDYHCGYCQNWVTSQMLRDPDAVAPPRKTTPRELVDLAVQHGAPVIASSYNEPLITSEWAVAIFKEAKAAGLVTGYVSNGNGTPQVLEYLRPWVDLYKVDLKSFDDRHYRQLGGRLQPILDTIRTLYEMGLWVEIVTLLIPGFNDSEDELRRLTEFVASVSPDIPWHVSAFHKDYKMTDPENTQPRDLAQAAVIGRAAGLRFIYAGNLPGQVGDLENTQCPHCHALLIERFGYHILDYRLTSQGACPQCGTVIPGRWAEKFEGQIAHLPYLPRLRRRANPLSAGR